MTDALICPKCGTPYKRNQLSCMKCNFLLFDPKASTVHIRVDPGLLRLRKAREPDQGQVDTAERMIHLQIRGLIEKLAFEEETEIVLGRVDLSNPDPGRFDLTPFGGHERGVSRAHALLRYADNQFTLTDLNSANGTTVNQRKLLPNEPLVLHDGDQLMLGSLSIGIRLDPGPLIRKTGPLVIPKSQEPPNILETPPRTPYLPILPKTAVLGEKANIPEETPLASSPQTTMPRKPEGLPESAPDKAVTSGPLMPATAPAVYDPATKSASENQAILAQLSAAKPAEAQASAASVPSPLGAPGGVPEPSTDISTKPMGMIQVLSSPPSETKPTGQPPVNPAQPVGVQPGTPDSTNKPSGSITIKPPLVTDARPIEQPASNIPVKAPDAPPEAKPAAPPFPPMPTDAQDSKEAKAATPPRPANNVPAPPRPPDPKPGPETKPAEKTS